MIAALVLTLACHGRVPPPIPDPNGPYPVFTAEQLAQIAQLNPAVLPPPPRDVSNRFADDPRAALLGQKLFFDPGFSGRLLDGDNDGSPNALGMRGETGKVSCAGCHVASAGFLDNRTLGKQISLATGWNLRRTPSLLDVGQAKLLMWDGRRDSLYNQPFGPLESATEMNSSRLFVAEQVFARYRAEYEAIFGPLPPLSDSSRFPPLDASRTGCDRPVGRPPTCHGLPGDGAEYDQMAPADQVAVTEVVVNVGKALGAYERLLTCGQGRFDRWARGDNSALSRAEQRGVALFVGRAQCVRCHAGPFFSDQKFHNIGLAPATVAVVFIDLGDRGAAAGLPAAIADPLNVRGRFSDGEDGRLPSSAGTEYEGAFRTPTLRCVSLRPSFMHTGQLRSLEEVVAFHDRGGHPYGYPGTNELTPLALSDAERQDLVEFLGSLDGPGPPANLLRSP
jgi:cytochrome c peroxidase